MCSGNGNCRSSQGFIPAACAACCLCVYMLTSSDPPAACVLRCSEYAAHHLLQQHHHHNKELLEAVAAAQPNDILQLQQQLINGSDMHLDMLCYGNISSSEAADIAHRVHQLLPAQGLSPGTWPALGRVLSISPLRFSGGQAADCLDGDTDAMQDAEAAVAAAAGRESVQGSGGQASGSAVDAQGGAGFSPTGFGPLCVTYLPTNPNPSNSNHAVYYLIQVCFCRHVCVISQPTACQAVLVLPPCLEC